MNWKPEAADDQALSYIGSSSAGEEANNALISEARSLTEGGVGDSMVDEDVTGTKDYDGLRVPIISWGDTHAGVTPTAPKRQLESVVAPAAKPKPSMVAQVRKTAVAENTAYSVAGGIDFSIFMPASQ